MGKVAVLLPMSLPSRDGARNLPSTACPPHNTVLTGLPGWVSGLAPGAWATLGTNQWEEVTGPRVGQWVWQHSSVELRGRTAWSREVGGLHVK